MNKMYYVCDRCGVLTPANVRACPSCAGPTNGPYTLEEIEAFTKKEEPRIFVEEDIDKDIIIKNDYINDAIDFSQIFNQIQNKDCLEYEDVVKRFIANKPLSISEIDSNEEIGIATVSIPFLIEIDIYFENGWINRL